MSAVCVTVEAERNKKQAAIPVAGMQYMHVTSTACKSGMNQRRWRDMPTDATDTQCFCAVSYRSFADILKYCVGVVPKVFRNAAIKALGVL